MMLEVRDLRAGYGRLPVLHDLSLRVPAEGSVAVLGPNGAGKSTLLKALARQIPIMDGELRFDGHPYAEEDATWAARHGIALVPQSANVFPDLTIRDNLRLSGMRRADGEAGIERAVTRFPVLGERAGQLAGSLSGGERQMLAISSALLLEPKLLLLDEPTTGLSPRAAAETADAVAEVSREGTAVLWVVEQMPELVLRRVRHAYVMEAGRIQFDGTPAELMDGGRLEQLLLQRA
ncbi:MAG: ABC transporter ATP-binding protein [Solirubrobacteraceae bacterium]